MFDIFFNRLQKLWKHFLKLFQEIRANPNRIGFDKVSIFTTPLYKNCETKVSAGVASQDLDPQVLLVNFS